MGLCLVKGTESACTVRARRIVVRPVGGRPKALPSMGLVERAFRPAWCHGDKNLSDLVMAAEARAAHPWTLIHVHIVSDYPADPLTGWPAETTRVTKALSHNDLQNFTNSARHNRLPGLSHPATIRLAGNRHAEPRRSRRTAGAREHDA